MVQSTETIRVAEARRRCSEQEHNVMASHRTQQLLFTVLGLRLAHRRENEKGRRRGWWTSAQRNISESPSLGISKCVTGSRCQISNFLPLNLAKSMFWNRGFSVVSAHQSSDSSSFLPSLPGVGGRNVIHQSIAAIRAKEKISLAPCSATQNRIGKTSQKINIAED